MRFRDTKPRRRRGFLRLASVPVTLPMVDALRKLLEDVVVLDSESEYAPSLEKMANEAKALLRCEPFVEG